MSARPLASPLPGTAGPAGRSPGGTEGGRARGPIRKNERGGHVLELVLTRALGTLSTVVAVGYVFGLVYLVAKGHHKITDIPADPLPEAVISGESVMRLAVAIVMAASAAYLVVAALKFLVKITPAGETARNLVHRCGTPFIAIAGAVGGVLGRSHVPSFLVSMPSETAAGGGVGPEIFNTLYFAVLSTAVTLPIGVGAAVYIARFSRSKPFVATLRAALDTLASLPSIVYGLFGSLVFVVQMKAGYSLFAGAFVLALLNLPLVVGVSEEALRAVPHELEDASIALGATRVQTTLRVTLPYAWPGILSAMVLSVGRVFAESAPLIMTAGTTVSRTNAFSLNPFRGGETLAVHLWYVNSAGLSPDKADVSAGTAAVLVVLIFAANVVASRLARFGGALGTQQATRGAQARARVKG